MGTGLRQTEEVGYLFAAHEVADVEDEGISGKDLDLVLMLCTRDAGVARLRGNVKGSEESSSNRS